jgi:hypothetical protein
MPYSNTSGVDSTYPTNSDPADVDDDLRDIKIAYNERLDDVMGVDWEGDDPIEPTTYGPGVALSSKQVGSQAEHNNGNSGTTLTIDWDNGNFQRVGLNANCTFTLNNPIVATYVLRIVNAGSFSITWPGSVEWPGGSVSQPTASRDTIFTLYWNGSYYNAGVFGANYQP